jgi:multiple sugar transport system ATP-binding protein
VSRGATSVELHHQSLGIPAAREPFEGDLVYGVRPEHVRLTDDGLYRGGIVATEYLGTTQIVTLETPNGELKARIPLGPPRAGGRERGARLQRRHGHALRRADRRAIRSALNEGVLSHG